MMPMETPHSTNLPNFGPAPTFVHVAKAPTFPDRQQIVVEQKNARLAAEEAARAAEAQAQAEQAAAQARAVQAAPAPVRVASVAPAGNCASWIAAAGIPDVANAVNLISRESGCNPNAVNPSSGACGVAQELPCGKSGCAMGDGACQVAWMNQYVVQRYGSWAGAIGWHNSHNWY
jgi:hypothetical protein